MGRRLRFAENFAHNRDRIQTFLLDRDPASAPARFSALLEDVERAGALLVEAPELGRPAAFLASRAPRVLMLGRRLQELGNAAQARHLREYVLRGHLGIDEALQRFRERDVHAFHALPQCIICHFMAPVL